MQPPYGHAMACSLEERVLHTCELLKNVNFMCSFVNFQINKVVVGSGHGDKPKYVGEVVALHDLWGESGVPNEYLNG